MLTRWPTEPYAEQARRWPRSGRHILAAFDDESVVVYQAYKPSIGHRAAADQRFDTGGDFSLSRMSWIKPNFMWMMYRSGWGTKPDQEVVLAVTITRDAFDAILAAAVHSSYVPETYGDRDAWQAAVKGSDVRLQWDPDHGPGGEPLERRAIQLGLRGETLARYAGEWIVAIEDASAFVAAQRQHRHDPQRLETPLERVYPLGDRQVATRLGVEAPAAQGT